MLFVEMPPHEVDVNVHPAKTEVRFVRGTIVYDLIRDSVRAAIASSKAGATLFAEKKSASTAEKPIEFLPQIIAENAPPVTREDLREGFRIPVVAQPAPAPQQTKIDLGSVLDEEGAEPEENQIIPATNGELVDLQPAVAAENASFTDTAIITEAEPIQLYGNRLGCLGGKADSTNAQLKPAQNLTLIADEINALGQMHNSFIIAADRTGLLLIDQHVAHERILFEHHWRALRGKKIETQRLLIPETLDLSPAQASTFDQLLPELEENGFELGRLSGRTIAIKAVPAMLAPGVARSLLLELLDAIEENRRGLSLDELRAEIAASLACRAAIKINMPLAPEKTRWLIDELLKMQNPATCPHGRPIILRITVREIERGFQRI